MSRRKNTEHSLELLSSERAISPFVLKIAQTMEQIRKDRNISKLEWIEKAGVSQSNQYKLEQGYQKTSFYTIENLAKVLDISMNNLFKQIIEADGNDSVEKTLSQSLYHDLTNAKIEQICLQLVVISFSADLALGISTKLLKEIKSLREKVGASKESLLKENAIDIIKRQLETIVSTIKKIETAINYK